jgi:tetratricopeptide (TPR) repeat protein
LQTTSTRLERARWLTVIGLVFGLLAHDASASVKSEIAFHRGVVAYGNGELDSAQEAFERVLAEDPEDTAAIHYLGLIAGDRGEPAKSVELYRQALLLDPDDVDLRFDLGSALLEAGEPTDAADEFDRVLAAQPDRARAQLFAGIAAYRAGSYRRALPYLDRAIDLDPTLRSQARYYTGLSQAHLQDFPAAAGAFADAEQSPLSPLSESARNLGRQVAPSDGAARRWALSFTAGVEFDTNPTIAGQTLDQDDDGRGVYRIRASTVLLERDRYSLTAGYDGYLSSHFEETFVDLMTHVGYLSAGANFDPVRLGLRYDYAYTFIDIHKSFRSLHRVTPTVSVRESNWGLSQVYYQYQHQEFLRNLPSTGRGAQIDRDGDRHTVGLNQFLFPGAYLPDFLPITYFRVGALGDFLDTAGTEFRYDSWEFSFGFGMQLPLELELSVFYRLTDRGYRETSLFLTIPPDSPTEKRDDLQNRLNFELTRAIGQHWQVSTAGSFTFNDSDVALYDYNREVIGAYLTYLF